jgi:hypothetical protein
MRKNKPLCLIICVMIIQAVVSGNILSQIQDSARNESGWKANEAIVTKLSKDGKGTNYYENKVPEYSLPIILTSNDGTKIKTESQWIKIRRSEILELFRKNMYGRVPATEYTKEFKVVSINKNALQGMATQKQVEIVIHKEDKSVVIHLTLMTPNGIKQPVPTFLLIDPWYYKKNSPEWKEKIEYWPATEAIKRGYGMAIFDATDLDPDSFDNFKNGIHGLLDKIPRPDDAWGTISAWAWGASRCMDYLVADKSVAAGKIAIVGHSRAGKTALWAGAEDTRFALVISNESGAGGAALARRRFGETVERLNTVFPIGSV